MCVSLMCVFLTGGAHGHGTVTGADPRGGRLPPARGTAGGVDPHAGRPQARRRPQHPPHRLGGLRPRHEKSARARCAASSPTHPAFRCWPSAREPPVTSRLPGCLSAPVANSPARKTLQPRALLHPRPCPGVAVAGPGGKARGLRRRRGEPRGLLRGRHHWEALKRGAERDTAGAPMKHGAAPRESAEESSGRGPQRPTPPLRSGHRRRGGGAAARCASTSVQHPRAVF